MGRFRVLSVGAGPGSLRSFPVEIALRQVPGPALLPSVLVDTDRSSGRFPAQNVAPISDSAPPPRPHPQLRRYGGRSGGGCRPFAPLQGGQRGNADGGEEAGIGGVRGLSESLGRKNRRDRKRLQQSGVRLLEAE